MTASTTTASTPTISDADVVGAVFGRSPAATSQRSATCSTPTRPGITTTMTASAASTAAPTRSSPT